MKRIVLVRPQGPRNVGSILRVVDNFGPAELVLVKPDKPSLLIHPDFEQMSHGVERIVEKIRVVDDLPSALSDCTGSYGFTARARDHRALRDWRDATHELVRRTSSEERIALVFGQPSDVNQHRLNRLGIVHLRQQRDKVDRRVGKYRLFSDSLLLRGLLFWVQTALESLHVVLFQRGK